ncbi:MAG: enoyl-CoA hydratase-related protein [Acidimicrobiia bacterium]
MSLALISTPRPHVGVITLNKPDRLNSMSFGLVEALYEAIDQVGNDNDVWVVILTGAGRGFCSGLDLEDMGSAPGLDGLTIHRAGIRAMAFMSDVVPALRRMPQPVIAAINGPAYGGGMCLTLGADIRIAGESATFCSAGIVNGLTSTELGVSYLLPRAIGTSHANEIMLTGREVEAREAERIGLVSRVVPDGELMDHAFELAERMCELSPFGVAMTKAVSWANLESSSLTSAIDLENRNQLLLGHTPNLDEAMRAFREKRKPVYEV